MSTTPTDLSPQLDHVERETGVLHIDLTSWITFDFTDDQWSKLVRLSGDLPQTARPELKNCVSDYLRERAGIFKYEIKTREARDRLRKKILSILDDGEWKSATASLEGLDIGSALGMWPPPPFGRMLDSLLKLLARRLDALNSWVNADSSRPGPKSSRPAYRFIANAAASVEKHTGKAATRSNKSNMSGFRTVITELCSIADPSITSGTIDEALKEYIKKRGQERRGEDRPSSV
jgi:hypothetical protein